MHYRGNTLAQGQKFQKVQNCLLRGVFVFGQYFAFCYFRCIRDSLSKYTKRRTIHYSVPKDFQRFIRALIHPSICSFGISPLDIRPLELKRHTRQHRARWLDEAMEAVEGARDIPSDSLQIIRSILVSNIREHVSDVFRGSARVLYIIPRL